jgi:hypothetical protein
MLRQAAAKPSLTSMTTWQIPATVLRNHRFRYFYDYVMANWKPAYQLVLQIFWPGNVILEAGKGILSAINGYFISVYSPSLAIGGNKTFNRPAGVCPQLS